MFFSDLVTSSIGVCLLLLNSNKQLNSNKDTGVLQKKISNISFP